VGSEMCIRDRLNIIDFALSLFFIKKIEYCYLDGTEWEVRCFKLHILMLCLDCQGVAVPMYFEVFNHKGVLSEEKRISFMLKATQIASLANAILVADREFIGDKWFKSFQDLSMSFVCRIRKGMYKKNLLNFRTYEALEKRALKKGRASSLIKIEDQIFRLWIVKNDKDDKKEPLIYILTNILDKRNTPNLYRLRWKIEVLFKHLKTNGYNMEDLSINDLNKIRLVIAMLILAFIFAILTALDERKLKKCAKKHYQNRTCYDEISVFKQGQSSLKQSFVSLKQFLDFVQLLNVKTIYPFQRNFNFVQ
jgi:hypothetical protein